MSLRAVHDWRSYLLRLCKQAIHGFGFIHYNSDVIQKLRTPAAILRQLGRRDLVERQVVHS